MRIKTVMALLLWPLGVFALYWVSVHFLALFAVDLTAGLRGLVTGLLALVPVYGGRTDAFLKDNVSADVLAYAALWLGLVLLEPPMEWLYNKWAGFRWITLVAAVCFAAAAVIVMWPLAKPFFANAV